MLRASRVEGGGGKRRKTKANRPAGDDDEESGVRSEEILLNGIHLRDSEPVDDKGE